ncbi:MAG: hypothetical protein MZW92_43600 [Comamonadaceae bacterium]|nr:hypothetical protein [Comamonadaceae bacterium]
MFHSREGAMLPLVKYLMLFLTLAALSFLSTKAMADFGMNVVVAKIVVEIPAVPRQLHDPEGFYFHVHDSQTGAVADGRAWS